MVLRHFLEYRSEEKEYGLAEIADVTYDLILKWLYVAACRVASNQYSPDISFRYRYRSSSNVAVGAKSELKWLVDLKHDFGMEASSCDGDQGVG